jgi:hypothetical protein
MKKTLLTLSLIFSFGLTQAQNLLTEGFDVVPVPGWTVSNLSTPAGAATWFQGNATDPDPDLSGPFDSYAGAPDSYIGCNFQSVTGNNTISNWLFTPSLTLQNGDVISFYTRTTTPGAEIYPDRLQMRIGVGATPAAPTGNTGVGGYTTLAVEVNPTLTTTGYPSVWTQYTYTVTGLATPTACKIAFRYFVTSGGPSGLNSDYIGIDSFSVDRPLSTGDFFSQNFSISPNPVKSIFNLVSTNGATAENVKVIDINGRTVTEMNISGLESVQINVSDLSSGVYFVKVQSELGIGTTKIIKN